MLKRKGFTLAEALIALVAIGLLMSLTIPAMLNSTNEKEFKILWRKKFDDFSKLNDELLLDNAMPVTDKNAFYALIQKKMNVIKRCSALSADAGICWPKANKWSTLTGLPINNGYQQGFVFADGTTAVDIMGTGSLTLVPLYVSGGWNYCEDLLIDVNGVKGPNKMASDIFGLAFCGDRVYPLGYNGESFMRSASYCSRTSTDAQWWNGGGCGLKAYIGEKY